MYLPTSHTLTDGLSVLLARHCQATPFLSTVLSESLSPQLFTPSLPLPGAALLRQSSGRLLNYSHTFGITLSNDVYVDNTPLKSKLKHLTL